MPSVQPAAVVDALRELADTASRVLPERSRGRARILASATRAAAAWERVTLPAARVGDDRAEARARAEGLRAARIARAEAARAIAEARRTARDVRSMPERALAAAWDVATAPPRAARDAIASALSSAADRVERVATAATTTAAQSWGGTVSTIGVTGLVLAAAALWWLTRK